MPPRRRDQRCVSSCPGGIRRTDSNGGEHGDGIPYGIPAEQSKSLSLLVAVLLDESGRDVFGSIADLSPIQSLSRDGISVPCELRLREAVDG